MLAARSRVTKGMPSARLFATTISEQSPALSPLKTELNASLEAEVALAAVTAGKVVAEAG